MAGVRARPAMNRWYILQYPVLGIAQYALHLKTGSPFRSNTKLTYVGSIIFSPYIVHCIQPVHCTLYSSRTLYIVFSPYIVHCIQPVHCTLYSARTLYIVFIQYIVHFIQPVHCTLYSGRTLYSARTLYIVHCIQPVHCTLYSARTLYIVFSPRTTLFDHVCPHIT